MQFGNVYKVTNIKTGEYYIGATVKKPHERFREHKGQARAKSNNALPIAIREHGANSFKVETVTPAKSERHLRLQEEFYFLEGKLLHPNLIINSSNFTPYSYTGLLGEKHANTKLTEEQAVIIARTQFKHGQQTKIAKLLGVDHSAVYNIIRNQNWLNAIKKAQTLPPLTFEEASKLITGGGVI